MTTSSTSELPSCPTSLIRRKYLMYHPHQQILCYCGLLTRQQDSVLSAHPKNTAAVKRLALSLCQLLGNADSFRLQTLRSVAWLLQKLLLLQSPEQHITQSLNQCFRSAIQKFMVHLDPASEKKWTYLVSQFERILEREGVKLLQPNKKLSCAVFISPDQISSTQPLEERMVQNWQEEIVRDITIFFIFRNLRRQLLNPTPNQAGDKALQLQYNFKNRFSNWVSRLVEGSTSEIQEKELQLVKLLREGKKENVIIVKDSVGFLLVKQLSEGPQGMVLACLKQKYVTGCFDSVDKSVVNFTLERGSRQDELRIDFKDPITAKEWLKFLLTSKVDMTQREVGFLQKYCKACLNAI